MAHQEMANPGLPGHEPTPGGGIACVIRRRGWVWVLARLNPM